MGLTQTKEQEDEYFLKAIKGEIEDVNFVINIMKRNDNHMHQDKHIKEILKSHMETITSDNFLYEKEIIFFLTVYYKNYSLVKEILDSGLEDESFIYRQNSNILYKIIDDKMFEIFTEKISVIYLIKLAFNCDKFPQFVKKIKNFTITDNYNLIIRNMFTVNMIKEISEHVKDENLMKQFVIDKLELYVPYNNVNNLSNEDVLTLYSLSDCRDVSIKILNNIFLTNNNNLLCCLLNNNFILPIYKIKPEHLCKTDVVIFNTLSSFENFDDFITINKFTEKCRILRDHNQRLLDYIATIV